MKRYYVLALALILLLAAACGSAPAYNTPTPEGYQPEPTAAPNQPAATAAPAPQTGATAAAPGGVEIALANIKRVDGVLATVNGEEVTWREFEPALVYNLHAVTQQFGVDWNQADAVAMIPQFEDSVLTGTISMVLMRQLAAAEGITLTAEQVQAQVDVEKASILGSGYYTDWAAVQKDTGISDEYFTQLVRDNELQKGLAEKHGVPRTTEQVHAVHILVEDEATANTVIERLNAGEDFGELAKELSIDTGSGANGGDLGWFPRGAMVPEFEEAAFSLEIGKISEPVQSDFGYHIIKVLEKEMREIEEEMYQALAQQAMQTWLDEQIEAADIDVKVKFAE